MAKSYNQVTLLGNLGKDPEIRTTPQGKKVCTLNLATTENFKDKAGNWQETTDWHRIVLWDYKADTAEKHLSKGSKVMIEGKLKTRSYEDNSGVKKYITEVLGSNIILIDSNSNQTSEPKENYDQTPQENDDVPF